MLKVCYFLEEIEKEDFFDLSEEHKKNIILKINSKECCQSGIKANVAMEFRENVIEDHYETWQNSLESKVNILCLSENFIINEDFNESYYESLLSEYDLLYNEDKSFYLTNLNCCKELINNQRYKNLDEAFRNLSLEIKQDIIKGV